LLTFLVIFVILWWLILFLILPIGVKKQESVKFGNDPGAPNNPMLKKKFLVTTIISFLLTCITLIIKNEIF
tara:strand:- start:521 stop:733 length:213 start_codon:yes stop_codon:yes gene_type:complete